MKTIISFFCLFIGVSPFVHAQTNASNASQAVSETAAGKQDSANFQCKGMLKPYREVRLASRAKGVIFKITKEGESVKEAQIVVQLEDNLEKLQLEQQKEVVNVREFENQAGIKLQGSSLSQIDTMEKKANFSIAKIQRDQAEEVLKHKAVLAPFDGIVTERMREVGEAVDELTPVLIVADLSKLYFEAFVPASRVTDVKEGQVVDIQMDTFPGKHFPGTVEIKSPVINPASEEFKVKILVENQDHMLSSGLTGHVTFSKPTATAATSP